MLLQHKQFLAKVYDPKSNTSIKKKELASCSNVELKLLLAAIFLVAAGFVPLASKSHYEFIKKKKKIKISNQASDVDFINKLLESDRRQQMQFLVKLIPIFQVVLASYFKEPKNYDKKVGFPPNLISITANNVVE